MRRCSCTVTGVRKLDNGARRGHTRRQRSHQTAEIEKSHSPELPGNPPDADHEVDPDDMVSESAVVGSRFKGSLNVTIVAACEAGRRSTRSTSRRSDLDGLAFSFIILMLEDPYVSERLARSPSLLDMVTEAQCVLTPSKVRWIPFPISPFITA